MHIDSSIQPAIFYSVSCIYVSKDDNLILNNQLLCSSPGKTIAVALSIH